MNDYVEKTHQELDVTFYPALYLQRRIWILNVLRKENITMVLDVGCGEGQLLGVLCQPAPWLTPPPPSLLPPPELHNSPEEPLPPSPTYNDEIPNLHITRLIGLDISEEDLAFSIQGVTPPPPDIDANEESTSAGRSYFTGVGQRWEELHAQVWKGKLEVINEEFVDIECIVSSEVIEHLSPGIVDAFAPMLFGVYHPSLFLITTPSYDFNARFTAPDAPPDARKGYPDPTSRTNRIFRHDDHQFEWTREEFVTWCQIAAETWGYEVQASTVGRAVEADPWDRDDELGGATSVAIFKRVDIMENKDREIKGRKILSELGLSGDRHELLASYKHEALTTAKKPASLKEIAESVKAKMDYYREAFMRVEEVWFERDIAKLCGGWIEFLVKAVEDSEDLNLKREMEGIEKGRNKWLIELIGGVGSPATLWPAEGECSIDYIPPDWIPGEGRHGTSDDSDLEDSTGAEADISMNNSEDDEIDRSETEGNQSHWNEQDDGNNSWGKLDLSPWETGWELNAEHQKSKMRSSPDSSTAGWDGDESDDTE